MFNDYKEIIGLIASVVILIALIMPNIKALRIINLIGAIIMVVYGVLIVKIPVIVMNGGSALINIYYLTKMFTHKAKYHVINVEENEEYFNSLNKEFATRPNLILLKDSTPISFYELNKETNQALVLKVGSVNISELEANEIINYLNNDKVSYQVDTINQNQILLTKIK